MANDPELTAFLAFILIRKTQPDVKMDALIKGVSTDGAADVLGKLLVSSGLTDAEKNSDGPSGSPTATTGA